MAWSLPTYRTTCRPLWRNRNLNRLLPDPQSSSLTKPCRVSDSSCSAERRSFDSIFSFLDRLVLIIRASVNLVAGANIQAATQVVNSG